MAVNNRYIQAAIDRIPKHPRVFSWHPTENGEWLVRDDHANEILHQRYNCEETARNAARNMQELARKVDQGWED